MRVDVEEVRLLRMIAKWHIPVMICLTHADSATSVKTLVEALVIQNSSEHFSLIAETQRPPNLLEQDSRRGQ